MERSVAGSGMTRVRSLRVVVSAILLACVAVGQVSTLSGAAATRDSVTICIYDSASTSALPACDEPIAAGSARVVPAGLTEAVPGLLSRLAESSPRAVSRVLATNTVDDMLRFGSRSAAREGLTGDAGVAANRFFRDATSKSVDFQAQPLAGGGYRLQFFSPANNPGYGKLYVQEIDAAGNVISEFKNTPGPDGLIETKWVHGGP